MSNNDLPARLTIVTVDDSPVVTERLQSILRDMDNIFILGNASNALTALSLINDQPPNVVILDIHLDEKGSQFNGINLLITLKQKYPKIKIIMLTNHTALQYRTKCISSGADYFFDKSYDFQRIPEALEEIASLNKMSNDI